MANHAGTMSEPMELPYAKCRELLAAGVGPGRSVHQEGATDLPADYLVVSEAIVFRTTPYGVVAAHDWNSPIAFEIDFFDHADHKGWSVLAVGLGKRLEDPDDIALVQRTGDPRPWASGSRPLYIQLRWDELTGRRLSYGWTHENDTPVRRSV